MANIDQTFYHDHFCYIHTQELCPSALFFALKFLTVSFLHFIVRKIQYTVHTHCAVAKLATLNVMVIELQPRLATTLCYQSHLLPCLCLFKSIEVSCRLLLDVSSA